MRIQSLAVVLAVGALIFGVFFFLAEYDKRSDTNDHPRALRGCQELRCGMPRKAVLEAMGPYIRGECEDLWRGIHIYYFLSMHASPTLFCCEVDEKTGRVVEVDCGSTFYENVYGKEKWKCGNIDFQLLPGKAKIERSEFDWERSAEDFKQVEAVFDKVKGDLDGKIAREKKLSPACDLIWDDERRKISVFVGSDRSTYDVIGFLWPDDESGTFKLVVFRRGLKAPLGKFMDKNIEGYVKKMRNLRFEIQDR